MARKEPKGISRKQVMQTGTVMNQREAQLERERFSLVESPESCFYGGIDPRRRKEASDFGLIREDRTACANLPKAPVMRSFKRFGWYCTPLIDDTVLE